MNLFHVVVLLFITQRSHVHSNNLFQEGGSPGKKNNEELI